VDEALNWGSGAAMGRSEARMNHLASASPIPSFLETFEE
jgi:hypothetical protein